MTANNVSGGRGWGLGWRAGGTAVLVACALVLTAVLGRPGLSARDEPPGRARLPADLGRVPRDAALVVSFRVADLWNSSPARGVRARMAREVDMADQEFARNFGVRLAQVERLTLVAADVGPGQPFFFVTTRAPYDRDKVVALAGADAREEKRKGHTLYVGARAHAVHMIDDRSFVVGRAQEVRGFLDDEPRKTGALDTALEVAAGKHLMVAGVNPAKIEREVGDKIPSQAEPFTPLLKAKTAVLTADLGERARADLRLTFADEDDARAGARALDKALDLGRITLGQGIKEVGKQKGTAAILGLLKEVQAGAREAQVKQQGSAVRVALAVKSDPASLGTALADAVQRMRTAAVRTQSVNNLKQLALANFNYLDTHGRFPPHAVYNKDGKPLLSWRVLILPYIEQEKLYKEFKLDEPWDSAHNKPLLARMPKTFAAPGDDKALKAHATHYQVFVGKGTAFEGKKGIGIADITDGTSNTIMIVEAARAVPWTKPEDLPYDVDKPLPKLGGLFEGGFNAAFCDGSVRFLRNSLKPRTLRDLITRNDGNPINYDE